ncbi:MAG TPA: hypothetical protein VI854_10080 [Acidimicrobiia bacterium]|nr:hypothetical protein [Acidimicrobiia bacterium]
MIVRTASLAALLTVVPLVGVTPASATTDGTGSPTFTYEPADRGTGDPDGGRDRESGPAEDEIPPDPCPTEMWSVPIEIEGLACVMLLPKESEAPEGEEPALVPVRR